MELLNHTCTRGDATNAPKSTQWNHHNFEIVHKEFLFSKTIVAYMLTNHIPPDMQVMSKQNLYQCQTIPDFDGVSAISEQILIKSLKKWYIYHIASCYSAQSVICLCSMIYELGQTATFSLWFSAFISFGLHSTVKYEASFLWDLWFWVR